jgi:hypothetical protein
MNTTKTFAKLSVVIASALLALAATACGSNSNSRQCGTLASGDSLNQGDSLKACHADFHLDMQGDGNLVLYMGQPVSSNALWATNTAVQEGATPGQRVTMQDDGDFVLFDSSGHPIVHSNTAGHPGAYINMQDDGNLVIYEGTATPSNAIWATGTNQ